MLLLPIQPGGFMMGSSKDEKGRSNLEGPQHRVRFSQMFWLGKFPVTQAEYQKVIGSNPSKFRGDNCPVENVSWNDAELFCREITTHAQREGILPEDFIFRLPTEAEWEYCCRAGEKTAYCYGNDEKQLGEYAWYEKNSESKTHDVGLKKANAWGLHDMHGNVLEWCLDRLDPLGEGYQDRITDIEDEVVDPISNTGPSYIFRGGGWDDADRGSRDILSWDCRSACRGKGSADNRSSDLGFRVCLASSIDGAKMYR
jgi:formylglycine-generating enzyme required for sulfatase activity